MHSTEPGWRGPFSARSASAFTTSSATRWGGTFNLPHAEVHTVILPHATAYNRAAAPEAMRIAAAALGAKDAAQGLYDLAVAIGAPVALKDIGMPADGLERAAELATQNPYANPRPVEYAGVLELLRNALMREPVLRRHETYMKNTLTLAIRAFRFRRVLLPAR